MTAVHQIVLWFLLLSGSNRISNHKTVARVLSISDILLFFFSLSRSIPTCTRVGRCMYVCIGLASWGGTGSTCASRAFQRAWGHATLKKFLYTYRKKRNRIQMTTLEKTQLIELLIHC
ncbi:hypothetical protein I7I53_03797 [Histoplasma capsulatum var. duboisii H88]|uniref:Secreted protein n=1 Tax=Ajellomyces capsulatus (strain H88) TaxID=544711 RepID=A0A8A1LR35_AJEC8|nr:hypothetical protein I7I53_03797 [Histoplasma capsulatum var. duboisii H88]